jgi:hypothetical protein
MIFEAMGTNIPGATSDARLEKVTKLLADARDVTQLCDMRRTIPGSKNGHSGISDGAMDHSMAFKSRGTVDRVTFTLLEGPRPCRRSAAVTTAW